MSKANAGRNLEVFLRSLNLLRAGVMDADTFEEELALFASDEDLVYELLNSLSGWLMGTLEDLGVTVEHLDEYLNNMTRTVDKLEEDETIDSKFQEIIRGLDMNTKEG